MIAATNPSTSGILVNELTTATAAPTTAPPTVPTIRSILAARVPPTLLCMTMDSGNHRPEPLWEIEPCRQFVGERRRDSDADGAMQLGPMRPQAIKERPG